MKLYRVCCRYLAVVHPISSMSWRTENHAIIAICIAWTMIFALSTPAFFVHGEVSHACKQPSRSKLIFTLLPGSITRRSRLIAIAGLIAILFYTYRFRLLIFHFYRTLDTGCIPLSTRYSYQFFAYLARAISNEREKFSRMRGSFSDWFFP